MDIISILILDGFPAGQSSWVQEALPEVLVDTVYEHIRLSEIDLKWCKGCFHCWLITPGECTIGGVGNDVARKFVTNDLVVFLSPVVFGSYSPQLKKAIDRFIPNIQGFFTQHEGETHHVKRYAKYPNIAVIGVQKTADLESAQVFRELAERNRLNFYPESFACHVFSDSNGSDKAQLEEILKAVGVEG